MPDRDWHRSGDVPFHSAVTKFASLQRPMPFLRSGEMFGT